MLQKYVPFPPGNQAGIFIRDVGKINVFVNIFNASTAPDFKQKQYLHRILL